MEGSKIANWGANGLNFLLGAAGTAMGATSLGSKTSEEKVREIIRNEIGGCGNGCYHRGGEDNLVNRYELLQAQRIAELESEKITDAKLLDLYKQTVAENKAIRSEIADVVASNSKDHETIYKELVAQREVQLVANGKIDKELALLKQADYFQRQLNDCRYYTTKKVVAKDDICPSVMPEYNSWTAPTTTETTA